jgi:voltage-gated potassium channel
MEFSQNIESKVTRKLLVSLLALVSVFVIGTVGYRILGGAHYSWMDCFYMVFLSITTIGFHEAVEMPDYEYGRLFTVFIAITGIGILGFVLSMVTAFMLEGEFSEARRRRKMEKKIAQLNGHYIVCGVGLVGRNVARDLEMAGLPAVIIDGDLKTLEHYLEAHPNQLYLHGDATDNDVLMAAGVMRAKGVFAVAHEDSSNLVISLSAKQLNSNARVVARCHDLKNSDKTRRAGADEVISPDFSGGLRIVSAMVRPNVMNFLDEMLKSDSNLRMEEMQIPQEMHNQPLSVLYRDNKDAMVLAIQRNKAWQFNPESNHLLQGDDVLMVMTTPEGRTRLERVMQSAN